MKIGENVVLCSSIIYNHAQSCVCLNDFEGGWAAWQGCVYYLLLSRITSC